MTSRTAPPDFEDRLRDRLVELDAVTPRLAEAAPAPRWHRRSLAMGAGIALAIGVGGVATAGNLVLRQDRPTTVEAGGSLDIKGAGCASGARVVVRLDGVEAVSTSAAADGSFATRLPVSRAESTGRHKVSARCIDSKGRDFQDTFAIAVIAPTPKLPAIGAPPRAQAGELLAVKGVGFPARAPVEISWDGAPIATARAEQDGTFVSQVRLPADAPVGAHRLTARAGSIAESTRVVVGTP